jgi:DNA-binding XRE family transcriptional regulator
MTTGSALQRERLDRLPLRVTVTAVAQKMGLSRQTVHTLERSEFVDDATAAAYLAAVDAVARDVTRGRADAPSAA